MEQLTIFATDNEKNPARISSNPFVAAINPTSYKKLASVKLTQPKIAGGKSEVKYNHSNDDKFTITDIVVDGTGVVSATQGKTVNQQLELLNKVACSFSGDKHQVPIVNVAWGAMNIFAYLNSIDSELVMFRANGEPVRAKLNIVFTEYKSAQLIAAEENKQSPDMSHLIEVTAGDSLPLLCKRIYKSSVYYLEIARVNNLVNFRKLVPGTLLMFPPLM